MFNDNEDHRQLASLIDLAESVYCRPRPVKGWLGVLLSMIPNFNLKEAMAKNTYFYFIFFYLCSGVSNAQRPSIDTKENFEIMSANISNFYNNVKRIEGINQIPPNACSVAMKDFSDYQFHGDQTGYNALLEKCLTIARPLYGRLMASVDAQITKEKTAAAEERKSEAALEQKTNTDLQSGKRKPASCSENLTAQGLNDSNMESVTSVSLVAPAKPGTFRGIIEQIAGKYILVNFKRLSEIDRFNVESGDVYIVNVDDSSLVFRGPEIKVGKVVKGFGKQVGTKEIKVNNGASRDVAVIHANCIEP